MSDGNLGNLTPPERYHPRVDANFMIKLLVDGRAIMAKARDLSMNGLFVVGGHPVERRDKVTIALPLQDREVVLTCWIRRVEAEGFALEYENLDWDDMITIARYLHPRLP